MTQSETAFTTQTTEAIPEVALDWHRRGAGAVLATVVETWGSAPRRAGSLMAVSGQGDIAGSVSGGCVEGAVVAESQDLLAAERPEAKLLEFGVSDENAFAVGLACGGTIRILLTPVGSVLPAGLLEELVAARAARRAVGLLSDLDSGQHSLVGPESYPERFAADRSGWIETGSRCVLTLHNPPARLAVVGAVHIAQALVPMARLAGFDVSLIDPRGAFASETRFPGERIRDDWPDEALADHGLDAHTAVVTLTHDPKLDDPALLAALRSDAFYVGALGSTRTHARRVERLAAAGLDAAQIARLHAPVGLDIGAQGPAEIAVSILAELVSALRAPA
ncbi:XdhC family protein [Celeribacter indicus]|uniref:Xanthine dehydrogenase accessory factor n=1 Tax=Celeribacter indicus TaxID=1208324 RepID=A0A0B5DWG1_9RHOB|nr:XdhC/CoxI family protein [Celeribacter indicus]AJE47723.1 xanthine dehydrogenase accessory factor [Celeribacter indicus]SDW15244.1 xanthine dehydrogenase accessory factor [Celeribacter indicus]